jgi:hypothetical protein
MKYDDASWHYGGEYPDDLPPENGGTHIAMFLAWAVTRGLVGELHREESAEDIQELLDRKISPGQFFFHCCDGKLTDEDFSDEGNAFAQHYFAPGGSTYGSYNEDYDRILAAGLPSVYHVEDSWENFDRLAPVIQQQFETWRAST